MILESKVIIENSETFKEILEDFSRWTNSTPELVEVFNSLNYTELSGISLLKITSIIEFSLGNVYQSFTHRNPPHLLKDLLEELANFNQVFLPNQVNIFEFKLHNKNFHDVFSHRYFYCK